MRFNLFLVVFLLVACQKKEQKPMKATPKTNKIIIAHRGASGYLPEHTLPAKAMAYAMNVDYLEQDLVLSRDNVPMVIHDIYLDDITDVSEKFRYRRREDGRYYVIDFTLSELKQLNVTERFNTKTGEQFYPKRFPKRKSSFKLHSLQEEIELIQGLNKSTGNNIGIYPEIKEPAFHVKEGKDISTIVLTILSNYGYTTKKDNCILQCFDAKELKRIREELKSELFLVQLIEYKEEEKQLNEFAKYADGLGPWYKQISPKLVKEAQDLGLKVHAYTFRADDLDNFKDFDTVLNYGFNTLNLDGVFTDHPDKVVSFLDKKCK